MPIFEYTCKDCGHDFEELVFDPEEQLSCPACKSTQTERKISAVAAQPHGSPGAAAASACSPASGFS